MDRYHQSYRGAPAPPSASRELDRFEVGLRRLQIEYEKFFSGALAVPPEDLRLELADDLRRLRDGKQLSAVDRFRLNGLEARFNTYSELFQRRLRDREEGRSHRTQVIPPPVSAFDAREGVVVGAKLDPSAAEAIYVALAKSGAPPKFDLATFSSYLERQAAAIREKTNCQRVRFRLEDEDGTLRLKAKPIKDEPSS